MSLGLIIAGWGLAIIVATTLIWRRRREKAGRTAWAMDHGMQLDAGRPQELMQRLAGLMLLQVGHSRRIDAAFTLPRGGYAICYHCQTGFDQNRYLHAWIVAAIEVSFCPGRAVITSQDWLLAAARSPSRRQLPVGEITRSPTRMAIVEDADCWRARLEGEWGSWLSRQPKERNWEFLPGWVVGYEPGGPEGPPLLALVEATRELAGFVTAQRPSMDALSHKD